MLFACDGVTLRNGRFEVWGNILSERPAKKCNDCFALHGTTPYMWPFSWEAIADISQYMMELTRANGTKLTLMSMPIVFCDMFIIKRHVAHLYLEVDLNCKSWWWTRTPFLCNDTERHGNELWNCCSSSSPNMLTHISLKCHYLIYLIIVVSRLHYFIIMPL